MEKLFVQHFYRKLHFNKNTFIIICSIDIINLGLFSSCIYTNYPVVRLFIRIFNEFA